MKSVIHLFNTRVRRGIVKPQMLAFVQHIQAHQCGARQNQGTTRTQKGAQIQNTLHASGSANRVLYHLIPFACAILLVMGHVLQGFEGIHKHLIRVRND